MLGRSKKAVPQKSSYSCTTINTFALLQLKTIFNCNLKREDLLSAMCGS